jgi:hypothetical protein
MSRPWIKNFAPPNDRLLLPELTVYWRVIINFPPPQLRPLIFPTEVTYRVVRQCCSYLKCRLAPTAFVALADPVDRLRERHP